MNDIEKDLYDCISDNNYLGFFNLLNNFENVDVRDEYGNTPLMMAAYMNRVIFIAELLKRGADPNLYENEVYN